MIGSRVGSRVGFSGSAISSAADDEGPNATTLTAVLADSKDPVITFGIYDYTLIVTNTGPNLAFGVSAIVTLDADTTFISGGGVGWSVSHLAGVVTCTRVDIAAGVAAPTITIGVRAPAAAETSTASVNASAINAPLVSDSENTVVNLVDRDATKGVYVPSSSTQWTNFIAFFGLTASVPNHLWLCQEAAGSLADSIGTMTLSPFISPLYNQAASGWSRLGVAFDAATADRFVAGAGVGPNPNTTSIMFLAMTHMDTESASFVNLLGLNTTSAVNSVRLNMSPSAGTNRISLNANGVNNNGTLDHVPGDYCWYVQYDRTNTRVSCASTIERVTGTYAAAVTDAAKGLGDTASVGGSQVTYFVGWSGAGAELNQADIKALIQALGFPVTGW